MRVDFLGVPVDCHSMEDSVSAIQEIIHQRKSLQHCVLNAHKLNLLKKDKHLAAIISQCGMVQADGVSIVWAARFLGLGTIPRVPGIDLMMKLLALADEKSYRVYFLGATEEVLNLVQTRILREFPRIVIAGAHNGYFRDFENDEVVQTIASSRADILFVAMPSPRKEYWLAENLNKLNVPFSMGVGGSFDVFSGKIRRAPKWMQKIGLEWLFRFLQEPIRLGPRYLTQNVRFASRVLKTRLNLE